MSIKLTATGDSCGKSSGFSPNGTYYAFACWWHPHQLNLGAGMGIIGFTNAAEDDYTYLMQDAGGDLRLGCTEGSLDLLIDPVVSTWYWMYARNDGTDLVAGIATATGTYTTISFGASAPVTSPTKCGLGSYFQGDTTYSKDWCVQNGLFWSGAAANSIPTVAELQAQRTRLRPLPMVGGGSTLLLPYAWWPTRGVDELGDLSGGGQTLVGVGLELGDSPPVGWGGVNHVIGAPALVNPIFALTALQRPVAGTCTMRVRARIVV